jgi:hypothetical protein
VTEDGLLSHMHVRHVIRDCGAWCVVRGVWCVMCVVVCGVLTVRHTFIE